MGVGELKNVKKIQLKEVKLIIERKGLIERKKKPGKNSLWEVYLFLLSKSAKKNIFLI